MIGVTDAWDAALGAALADKLGAYGIWGGLDPDERGRLGVGS